MIKETIKKKVHQSYTIQEKMIFVQYALRESNTKAAAKFGLDKSQVGCWGFFPEEEAQLYVWIVEI
ncbi:24795_t:CDS:2, partial [Racocetra persica]